MLVTLLYREFYDRTSSISRTPQCGAARQVARARVGDGCWAANRAITSFTLVGRSRDFTL